MSSILLQNPFASQPPLVSANPPVSVGPNVVAPASGASSGAGSGDSTAFGRSGNGYGGGDGAAMSFRAKSRAPERPTNATPDSVVGAQVSERPEQREIPEKVGPDLPKVDMPDPLPTSPFLLKMAKD